MKDNIKRSKQRVKDTGEVFTPTELVNKMLDDLDIDWTNPPQDETFLDPTCGNGQFLHALYVRGIPAHNLYGVDLMEDNVKHTLERVPGANIVQGDALTFDYLDMLPADPKLD